MQKLPDTLPLEYDFVPAPDAEERLAQAWDLIVKLILEDYQSEQSANSQESETCLTPSESNSLSHPPRNS